MDNEHEYCMARKDAVATIIDTQFDISSVSTMKKAPSKPRKEYMTKRKREAASLLQASQHSFHTTVDLDPRKFLNSYLATIETSRTSSTTSTDNTSSIYTVRDPSNNCSQILLPQSTGNQYANIYNDWYEDRNDAEMFNTVNSVDSHAVMNDSVPLHSFSWEHNHDQYQNNHNTYQSFDHNGHHHNNAVFEPPSHVSSGTMMSSEGGSQSIYSCEGSGNAVTSLSMIFHPSHSELDPSFE